MTFADHSGLIACENLTGVQYDQCLDNIENQLTIMSNLAGARGVAYPGSGWQAAEKLMRRYLNPQPNGGSPLRWDDLGSKIQQDITDFALHSFLAHYQSDDSLKDALRNPCFMKFGTFY